MRKKIVLLLSFVCAFALVFGVFIAGCNKNKGNDEEVTVTISKTELNLTTGGTGTLTATASDGSEIVWTTSNEAVASVNNGKVKGESAGTATITATVKDGTANATCAVTVKDAVIVTFKDADGNEINEASLEMRSTMQLSITASDNSTAARWTSSDPSKATVDENGLITGILPGEVTITVRTSSNVDAKITVKITAVAGFKEIKETRANAQAGDWWYYTSAEGGRKTDVLAAYAENDVVTFNFSGEGNWYIDDIQLGHIVSTQGADAGWTNVTGKITISDIETTDPTDVYGITIFDTMVPVTDGSEITFSVCYEQTTGGDDLYIRFAGNGALIKSANVTISDLEYSDHNVETLVTPSFKLTETEDKADIAITDTDNDPYGVMSYLVGLFLESNKTEIPDFSQNFDISGGDLDTYLCEVQEDTEYIVKIKAVAQPGYNDSVWSSDNGTRYTVKKHEVKYDMASSGENGALSSSFWTYWSGDGGAVSMAEYNTGTVTVHVDNFGWAWYSVQLFRNYSEFAANVDLHVKMVINATHAGRITITGNVVEIKEGTNEINLYFKNPSSATLSIQLGVNDKDGGGFDLGENATADFVFSGIVVEQFIPEKLAPVSGTYTPADGETPAKIEITDNSVNENKVLKYEVGFFGAEDKLVGSVTIAEDGTFSDLAIKDGTYVLKVRACPILALYTVSDWTEIASGYVVANGGTVADLTEGNQDNSCATKDTWTFYNGNDNNLGVNVTTAKLSTDTEDNETITIAYDSNKTQWWGVQLFYKNSTLTASKVYGLSLTIDVDKACNVTLNGTVVNLVEGKNNVTVYYAEGGANNASFALVFGVADGNKPVEAGSFTITNVKWEEYTDIVTLAAPSVTIDEDGIIHITDTNTAGVGSYTLNFTGPKNTDLTNVQDGDKLDVSRFETGNYVIKVKAIASDVRYISSALSEGFNYALTNEGGVSYDVTYSAQADISETGIWYYWNSGAKVTSAKFADNKLTITYTENSGIWYGLQLFMKLDKATNITFTIESSAAGHITVCDTDVTLTEGTNTVTVQNKQAISVQFASRDQTPDIQSGTISITMEI